MTPRPAHHKLASRHLQTHKLQSQKHPFLRTFKKLRELYPWSSKDIIWKVLESLQDFPMVILVKTDSWKHLIIYFDSLGLTWVSWESIKNVRWYQIWDIFGSREPFRGHWTEKKEGVNKFLEPVGHQTLTTKRSFQTSSMSFVAGAFGSMFDGLQLAGKWFVWDLYSNLYFWWIATVGQGKCIPNSSLSYLLFLASVFSFVGKCILELCQVYHLFLAREFLKFGKCISVFVFKNFLDCNCSVGHSECIPDSNLCLLLFLVVVF